MKQRFAAVIEMSSVGKQNEYIVKLRIPTGSQAGFTLALVMLRYMVVEAIVIHDPDNAHSQLVEIRYDSRHQVSTPTFAFDNRLVLNLTDRDIDYWLIFFLRYCRDGIAEVDHLDVELDSESGDDTRLSIIVAVENSQPSVPGDEARRLLGL